MELISARDAALFLSQSAPPVWVHRALLWMLVQKELDAYADSVTVRAYSSVFSFTQQLYQTAGEFSGAKMDAAILAHYPPEMAEKLLGKHHHDNVYDDPHTVEGSENIGAIDPGFFVFSSKVDWNASALEVDWLDEQVLGLEIFFSSQDFVGTEFENPIYDVKFSGIKFEARRIELLLPSASLRAESKSQAESFASRSLGRPTKWDWDGAMAFVVAQAQTPDGLPTGHGAQAKIEAMVADWFETETGDSPAISQIRKRASRVIEMIERGKKP